MIKTVLVLTGGSDSDHIVFETARAVAKPFGAHLDFFHVRVAPGEAALYTPHADFARGQGLRNTLDLVAEESNGRSVAAARHVREFCHQWQIPLLDHPLAADAVSASFCEETGHAPKRLLERARLNDLTVMGRFTRPNGLPPDLLEDLLRGCGRPILLAPAHASTEPIGTVMLCWKDAPEPARALTAAMPLLRRASRVVVVTVEASERAVAESASNVAAHLAWHGIHAEAQSIAAEGHSTAATLIAAARDCRANLLVMGCYGHGRARAAIFGSCTQTLLSSAELPVFLLH